MAALKEAPDVNAADRSRQGYNQLKASNPQTAGDAED